MQHELVLLEGAAQLVAEREQFRHAGVEFGGEKGIVGAAVRLGLIHRAVGKADQRGRIGSVQRIEADADAGGDMQHLMLQYERRAQRLQ